MKPLELINVDEFSLLTEGLNELDTAHFSDFYSALSFSGINGQEFIQHIKGKHLTSKQLQNQLLQYIIKTKSYDFSSQWYKNIIEVVNDVNRRYLNRKRIPTVPRLDNYRVIFNICCDTIKHGVYDPLDKTELFYYVAAQYSSRCDVNKGFLTPMQLRFFTFNTCYDIYQSYKQSNLPSAMIGDRSKYLYHDIKLHPFYGYKYHELVIKDMHSARFVTVALPIISGKKLPNLKQLTLPQLHSRLATLEFLIIREECINRKYYKTLFNIEHLRTYIYARSKHPRYFNY